MKMTDWMVTFEEGGGINHRETERGKDQPMVWVTVRRKQEILQALTQVSDHKQQ